MNNNIYTRTGLCCLLALPFLLAPLPKAWAAIPAEWKNTAFAYEAENKSLREVLEDFAHTFGTQLQIEGLLEGSVKGKIRANTPQSLLDRLGVEHRFQWYLYSNTLYISTLDQQESARLEVSSETIADLKHALTDIGLLDSRFGWGELPEDGVVLVSGPRHYIEQIKQFSSQRRSLDEKQSVLSFPLKFANATDRQVDYRGEKLTIPGVASILQGLLEPRANSTLDRLNQRSTSNPAPLMPPSSRLNTPLLGQMLGANANAGQMDAPHTITPRAPTSTNRIRVEADVRNNAVLIYDLPDRQAMYRDLITQLDVARKLVEIDAIILDIERTQLREFGVNWGFQNSRFRGGVNMAPGTSSQVSIENRERFYADIRALEAQGLASMVSNPSVLTLENQPAVIDFNRTQYLTPGRENATILPVTVGTSFQVVPRVITSRGSHQIHLAVDIEDGNFDETNLAGARSARRRSWRKSVRWWSVVFTSPKAATSAIKCRCWAISRYLAICFSPRPNGRTIGVNACSSSPRASLVIKQTHHATCPKPNRPNCRRPSHHWRGASALTNPRSSAAISSVPWRTWSAGKCPRPSRRRRYLWGWTHCAVPATCSR
jgi:type III secretion protein C